MSVKHSEIVKFMATKLGYKHEIRTLSKACEYERLLKLTSMGKTSASDTAIAVICLDLAASIFGLPFDMDLALKLAAVKRTVYTNTKRTIEKLLNIENVVTVNSLCVLLGCTAGAAIAEYILNHFKDIDVKNSDLSHPQFVCMAVYQACSHLKASQWNELEAEWTKMVQSIEKELNCHRQENKSKKSQNMADLIDSRVKEMSETNQSNETNSNRETVEDYEIWKERVLKQAYKEMELLRNKDCVSTDSTQGKIVMGNLNDTPKINRQHGVKLIFQ